jgi:hypothetical protein
LDETQGGQVKSVCRRGRLHKCHPTDGKHVSSAPYQPAPIHPSSPLLLSTSTTSPTSSIIHRKYPHPFFWLYSMVFLRCILSLNVPPVRCRLPSKKFSSIPLSNRPRQRRIIISPKWIRRCVCLPFGGLFLVLNESPMMLRSSPSTLFS